MPNSDRRKAGCYGAKGGVFNSCFPLHEDSPDQGEEDRSCWLRIPRLGIRLNPIVSLLSMTVIWGCVAWGITYPDDMEERLASLKPQITKKFTWFYISSKAFWIMFAICLYFSKYSKIKLGKEDDLPEYSTATWFFMIFGAHGGGIYYFSVAGPIWHYTKAGGDSRFTVDGYMPDNTLAQWAMNTTFYHWGLHGWVIFCLTSLAVAVSSYHFDLPLTMKSSFYPVLGDKIYGWMGDIIDIISVISTICGLSSTLGFAAIQINGGLHILDPNISETMTAQLIIIWGLTSVATVSALSGIRHGIRILSHFSFVTNISLILIILFVSDTWYLLNLFVQSVGFYFQWFLQQSFHTDAFEQIGPSAGGTSRGRNFPDGSSDGPEDWMDNWTMFFWAWWVAFAPFNALFMARISKGRTIREFIMGAMCAPALLTIIWLTIFGGTGINMERNAAGIGLCCDGNFNKSVNATWFYADDPHQSLCENEQCNTCAQAILSLYSSVYQNDSSDILEHFSDKNFGMTLPDKTVTRLSCHSETEMWFDVMNSFGGLGMFLSGLSTVGLMSMFITSSDGGSFMVDCMSANGERNPPRIQRAFWSITEGAMATAMIWYGGDQAMVNLQTISIIAGFPFHIVICVMCISLWKALPIIAGDLNPHGPHFSVSMFDVFAKPTTRSIGLVLLNIIIAPYSIAKVIVHTGDNKWKKCKLVGYTAVLSLLLMAFILLHVAVIWVEEIWAVAWVCYLMFAVAGGATRVALRYKYKINGNIIEDMLSSILMYPVSAWQISDTIEFYRQLTPEDREGEMHPAMHSGEDHSHPTNGGTAKLEILNEDLTTFC